MIVLGPLLLILGFALRVWAAGSNPSFSRLIKTPESLAVGGAYRYVRHPGYTGSLLMILGFGVLLASPGVAAFGAIIMHALLQHRADQEEQIMTESYPEYAQYQRTVGQFLPKARAPHVLW